MLSQLIVSQLSWSFCVGSNPKDQGKKSEGEMYMEINNSEV